MVLTGIGPGSRNELTAAIGENQKELKLALPPRLLQDPQRVTFKRMGLTDNSDRVWKVLEMGSVSCGPLTP